MNEQVIIITKGSTDTRNLVQGLKSIGIRARLFTDGRAALDMVEDQRPAVIVIDSQFPDRSGLDLCRIVKTDRRTRSVFVLLLLDNPTYQREAFELGAADCVLRPVNVQQLVLQVRNLLSSVSESAKAEELKVGDLLLDRARHEVRAANSVIQCTPKEFVLLSVLMERSGRVQTREQLLNDLWECDAEIGPRAIDRHICFLRAKLGPLHRYIETVPSAGYRLVAA